MPTKEGDYKHIKRNKTSTVQVVSKKVKGDQENVHINLHICWAESHRQVLNVHFLRGVI